MADIIKTDCVHCCMDIIDAEKNEVAFSCHRGDREHGVPCHCAKCPYFEMRPEDDYSGGRTIEDNAYSTM